MSETSVYRRILRRETHSPRSTALTVVAVAVMLLCAWLGTEIVLAMLDRPALLVAPGDLLRELGALDDAQTGVVAAAGAGLLIVGFVILILAISPGRRARRRMAAGRGVVVVDDEVIASALSRHASHAGDVDPDNSRVSVARRRAEVRLTPTSGIGVRRDAVTVAVAQQLDEYELTPTLAPRILVSTTGRVGA